MATGINRHYLDESLSISRKNAGLKCVFLSHQKDDSKTCKFIADYIKNAGIDVYFDEYDKDLKNHLQSNNAKGVVNSIRKGINQSSHMLCILSPNTLDSKWVPWEVGYGYDLTNLIALTLKGISDYQLPEYIKAIPIIRGTKSLNDFISILKNESQTMLFSERLIIEHTKTHPLDSYLDYNL